MSKEEQNTDKQQLKSKTKSKGLSKNTQKTKKQTVSKNQTKPKKLATKVNKKRKELNIKQKAFLDVYQKTLGNVTASCKHIDINRGTYYKWLNNDMFVNEIEKIEPKKQMDDFVVSKMIEAINNGDTTLIKEYLNKRAKSIGMWDEGALDEQLTQINIQIVGENDKEINIETNNKLIEDEL